MLGMTDEICIWLIEDSSQYTKTITFLINEQSSGMRIEKAFIKIEEALEHTRTPFAQLPDVLLLDIELPGMSGIEGARDLKEALPTCTILMLSSYSDADRIYRAMSEGASGYLLKEMGIDEISTAIRQAARGALYAPPSIAKKMLSSLQRKPAPPDYALTSRQFDILRLLCEGMKQEEIGETLHIAPSTVDNHLRRVYQKLHVNSGIQAVCKAYQEGLI